MKKTILILSLIIFSNISAQDFNCHNIDRYQLNYIYQQNENKFKIVNGNIDYMKGVIESLSVNSIRQICINNWGIYQQNGKEYMYNRFTNNYGYIDRNYYYNNITYLEILGNLKSDIKSRLR